MTRRSIFKTLLGCMAAPFAALGFVQKPQNVVVGLSLDLEEFKKLLPQIKQEITEVIAEAMQRDTDRKLNALVEQDVTRALQIRYKTENHKVFLKVGNEDWKPLVRDLRT